MERHSHNVNKGAGKMVQERFVAAGHSDNADEPIFDEDCCLFQLLALQVRVNISLQPGR